MRLPWVRDCASCGRKRLLIESPQVDSVILGVYQLNMPVEEKTIGSVSVASLGDPPASGHVRFVTVGQMLWGPYITTIMSVVVGLLYNVPPGAVLVVGEEDRKRWLLAFTELRR